MHGKAWPILLAALLLTTGCIGLGGQEQTDQDVEATDTGDQRPAPQPEAKSQDPETPEEDPVTDEDSDQALQVLTHVVDADGTLPLYAGVNDPLVGPYVFYGEADRWFEIDLNGTVTSAELTMEWEATNPTMETLLIGFGEREGSGDNSRAAQGYEIVRGASPLTLSVDGLDWDKGKYVVWAWWDRDQPSQVNQGQQDFTLTGEITYESLTPAG